MWPPSTAGRRAPTARVCAHVGHISPPPRLSSPKGIPLAKPPLSLPQKRDAALPRVHPDIGPGLSRSASPCAGSQAASHRHTGAQAVVCCPEGTMAIIHSTNRRNDVSCVGQSARERGSPVREPWSPALELGPIAAVVPHAVPPCMTIEMSSQVDRGLVSCMSRIAAINVQVEVCSSTGQRTIYHFFFWIFVTGQIEWQIRSACHAVGSDLTASMLQCPGLAAPDRIRIRNSIVPSNTPAVNPSMSARCFVSRQHTLAST